MESHLCNNCKTVFEGSYCFNCGQGADLNQRLKLGRIITDFFDNTFNLHKGFFYTFWQLIVFPSTVLKDYINGVRRKYTNPTRYLVIALAVLAFGQYWAEMNEAILNDNFEGFSFLPEQLNKNMRLWDLRFITEWTLLGNLMEALIFPVGFYWSFKSLKYNYAELLVISFYLIANSIFITMLLVGIPKFLLNLYASVSFVVTAIILYYFYALITFFTAVPMVKRIFFTLLGLAIFFFLRFFILPLLFALVFPLGIY